jgi:hypothetical protein
MAKELLLLQVAIAGQLLLLLLQGAIATVIAGQLLLLLLQAAIARSSCN